MRQQRPRLAAETATVWAGRKDNSKARKSTLTGRLQAYKSTSAQAQDEVRIEIAITID